MSTLDLLVIHPGAQHGIYGALGDTLTALEPPTWARIVAAYVRDRGFSVAIVDQEAEGLSAAAVAYRAQELRPRLVAIVVYGHQPSASTQQMIAAGEVARELRFLLPDVPRIMLGNHPSALSERTLREEATTWVADGEGVQTIVELLRALDQKVMKSQVSLDITHVPGLVMHDVNTNHIIATPLAPLVDPQDLHGDAWDLLPMNRYRAHNWQCLDGSPRAPYASIYTTFGCPFKCSFCMINAFQHANRYRMRDPIKVADQITRLYLDYGVRTFKIADEMFVLNERHYTAVAECIEETIPDASNQLNIWAYARVDTVKPDHLALLRRAGFRWLALGIESADPEVRDGAEKRMRTDDVVGTVRAIQAAGISVVGNYIFGLRDDTTESMERTLRLAVECNTEWANFYSAMAYPGSRLYEEAVAEGLELPATWSGYSQHNRHCHPLGSRHLTPAQVLEFRDRAHVAYFSSESYQSMLRRKFGSGAVAEIDRMLRYELPRDLLGGRAV